MGELVFTWGGFIQVIRTRLIKAAASFLGQPWFCLGGPLMKEGPGGERTSQGRGNWHTKKNKQLLIFPTRADLGEAKSDEERETWKDQTKGKDHSLIAIKALALLKVRKPFGFSGKLIAERKNRYAARVNAGKEGENIGGNVLLLLRRTTKAR